MNTFCGMILARSKKDVNKVAEKAVKFFERAQKFHTLGYAFIFLVHHRCNYKPLT